MHRECTSCGRPFTPRDLARQESRGMEAERRALGLQGIAFRYYMCPACDWADIFIDVARLAGESPEAFHGRRGELEAAVRQLHAERVDVVLMSRG